MAHHKAGGIAVVGHAIERLPEEGGCAHARATSIATAAGLENPENPGVKKSLTGV